QGEGGGGTRRERLEDEAGGLRGAGRQEVDDVATQHDPSENCGGQESRNQQRQQHRTGAAHRFPDRGGRSQRVSSMRMIAVSPFGDSVRKVAMCVNIPSITISYTSLATAVSVGSRTRRQLLRLPAACTR